MQPLDVDNVNSYAYAEGLIPKNICNEIVAYGKNLNKEIASTSDKNINNLVRKGQVAWIEPVNEFTKEIYSNLTTVVEELNNRYFNFNLYGFQGDIQFTEYIKDGDFYTKHLDKMFERPIRKLSIVVQLSDPNEYKGSELLLHLGSAPDKMPNTQGTVIAFPSYVLHEVTPLLSGERYSLVAWITGESFK